VVSRPFIIFVLTLFGVSCRDNGQVDDEDDMIDMICF